MRYGLRFADGDPFPRDGTTKLRLDDEPVEVVPEDCADCPECPDACEPSCDSVLFHYYKILIGEPGFEGFTSEFAEGSAGDTVITDPQTVGYTRIVVTVLPTMQKCGHRTRAVVTNVDGTWDISTTLNAAAELAPEDHIGVAFAWTILPLPAPGTTNVQMQIDLTDAAEGDETWTDFGPLIVITDSV